MQARRGPFNPRPSIGKQSKLGLPQQGTVATRGEGLYEGLDWLANTLKDMQRRGQPTSVGQGSANPPRVK